MYIVKINNLHKIQDLRNISFGFIGKERKTKLVLLTISLVYAFFDIFFVRLRKLL